MSDELPSSLKAEQALLGILLYDPGAFERVPEHFRADHFHDPVHQRIYAVIYDAMVKGGSADLIVLQDRFTGDEAFAQMGGFAYLADLVDRAPPADAADFALLIYDLFMRRQMIAQADALRLAALSDRSTPALDILEKTERNLFALTATRTDQGARSFGHYLGGAIEMAAQAYQRDGGLAGLSTSLMDLDQKLGGLAESDLVILAARPSMGKTALATNMAFHTAKTYETAPGPDGLLRVLRGGVVAMFSLEMSGEQLALRILAEVSGISGERIRKGEIDAHEFSRMRDAAYEIQNCPLYIDATGALSISALATRCRRLKRSVGLHLVVVDYLQLVTTGNPRQSAQEKVSEVTQGLKALAKELNVPVIALSQLTRDVEKREDKRPQLSDLRESGAIEQDADVVMFLFREAYYLEREATPKEGTKEFLDWEDRLEELRNVAEIIIGKQRHGPIGTVKVAFQDATTRFSNLAREDVSPAGKA